MTDNSKNQSLEKLFIKYQEAWLDGKVLDPKEYCEKHLESKDAMALQTRIEEFLFVNECLNLDLKSGQTIKSHNGEKQAISDVLGDFRIVKEIGRGGMGIVYEAVQISLNRTVALKVLPAHITLRKESVVRFQREAATAARLKHPGIVEVYAVGEADGNHYFAMEFVEGAPLNKVIERICKEKSGPLDGALLGSAVLSELHIPSQHTGGKKTHADKSPLNKTFIETTCHLVIQVANALYFAHQANVIHRDVKPSNIIMRKDGSVVLTDFGLAREQDLPSLTITGEFAGTPHYIAPEQTLNKKTQVDHRADVYSLGVTLFELLTLSKPFDGKTSQEIIGKILSHEPPLLRGLNALIPRDLQTICMTAMEKDPKRRYQSALEFSNDLKRLVEYKPIKAQPVGVLIRAFRLIRRNPATSLVVALTFLLVVVGPLLFGLQQRLANVQINKALYAKNEALKRADLEAKIARREMEIATQVSDYLVEIFEVPMPSEARGKTIAAFEILQNGAQSIEDRLTDQPIIKSRILEIIGLAHKSLGLYSEAAPLFAQALDTHTKMLGEKDDLTLGSMKNLGTIYLYLGRCDDAEPLLEKAYKGFYDKYGKDDDRTLTVKSGLGLLYHRQSRLDKAERFYRETLEARQRLFGNDHPITLEAMNNLAFLYKRRGRFDEAEPLYLAAVEGCARCNGDDHPDTLTAMSNLSLLYDGWACFDKAVKLCKQTLKIRRRILGDNHPDTLNSWNNLALMYKKAGRLKEAEDLYLKVLKNRYDKLGKEHPDLLVTKNNLATLYIEQGRFEEASEILHQVLVARKRILGEDHYETLVSLCNIAILYAEQGRYQDAEPLFQKALEGRRRLFGEEHPDTLNTLNCIATLYVKQGRLDEAEAIYKETLKVCREKYSNAHHLISTILCNFAHLCANQGRFEEAERLVREAVKKTNPDSKTYTFRKGLHEAILKELKGR